ncbi:MAG: hypothetical protein V4592_00850 [Bacteroidota bacterium]
MTKDVTSNKDKSENQYARIAAILDKAKGKDLFESIEDPVQWQRDIRDEWERDFTKLNPPIER